MKSIESLSYVELVDLLADKTSHYTTVLKDQRNTFQHSLLKEEIEEIIKLIQLKSNIDEIEVNPGTKKAES